MMIKTNYIIIIVLFFTQQLMFAQSNERCHADQHLQQNLAINPKLAEKQQHLNIEIEKYLAKQQNTLSKQAGILTIPVVVHVVYHNETQNISDAQIQSQIDVLNADFRKQNNNINNTPSEFAGLAADCEIEFCLVSVAPDGSATNGITRTHTTYSTIGSATTASGVSQIYYDDLGGKNAWNTEQYVNIWVGELNFGLLGYATYPTLAAAGEDGIVMSYEYFGTTGTATAPYNGGRTLTHEMGHFFGLYHIWGTTINECEEDDSVTDTPQQNGPHYSCPSYPQTSCSNSSMFMNYMDYTDDACMTMFSVGQKERMTAAIYTFRFGLLSSPACGAPAIACPYSSLPSFSEDICEGTTPNLPIAAMQNATDETTGEAAGEEDLPTIFWFTNPSLSSAYTISPATHYGNKCWHDDPIKLYAAVLCIETNSYILVGTYTYTVYPLPQAPFIVKNDNECTYSVIPACLYDTVSPSNFTSLALGTPAGETELLVLASSSLSDCNSQTFVVEYPACEYVESECSTFESTNTNMTIEATSNFALVSELYVSKSGMITDINVSHLDISHSFLGDLDIVLESPNGMMTILFSNACGDQDDFNLVLDDEAPDSIFPCPATNGLTYQPHGILAAFNGQNSQGIWKLHVVDYYAQDGGMLNDWALEICTEATETTSTKAHIKTYLEAAYNSNTNLMRTELLPKNLIPLTQPYNIEPWYYDGAESVSSYQDFPANIVDWILVEARSATDNEEILDIKAAFLRNDGIVIDADGTEGVGFENLTEGQDYYIVIRHRNHLAIMSEEVISLPNTAIYDFTQPANVKDGETQLANLNDNDWYAMAGGDFDANGVIIVVDFNIFKSYLSLINVYTVGDVNMDGSTTVTDFNYYRPNISRIGLSQIRY
ncbi:MAG: M43 family zinc metalloprotease [Chitinophagales bacterium]